MVIMAVIVVFVIYSIFSFFSFTGETPIIVGKMNGKHGKTIEQYPNNRNATPIKRSNNAATGLEFTWSVWIYIDDLDYGSGTYRHIFHKGNDDINYTTAPTGLNYPNNGPGLYITHNKNNLLLIMNTFDKIEEKITIESID